MATIRAYTVVALTVSLMVLAGCSNSPKSADANLSPKAKLLLASKKQAEAKAKQIAELKKQKDAELAKSNEAKKQLSIILAQSDSALKLANNYKNLAAKTKDATKKAELQERANKAQKIADDKSVELVTLDKGVYEMLGHVRQLDSKIAALNAEKKRAEQLALGINEQSKKM